MKLIQGMKNLFCEERLREVGLFSFKQSQSQLLLGTSYSSLPVPEGHLQESWRGAFSKSGSDGTGRNGIN